MPTSTAPAQTVATPVSRSEPQGDFVERDGETRYEIRNVGEMPPFLMTIVGDTDLWMYLSSAGSFTAGRVEPDRCLFPYETDDTLHQCSGYSGPITVVRFADGRTWRPFDDRAVAASRILRRTPVGDVVELEETDEATGLIFRAEYALSDEFGIVRHCELALPDDAQPIEFTILDGYLNIMPASVPLSLQQQMSTLVDGYKRSELVAAGGPAIYALEAAISDSPEAKEALRVNAVWHTGLPGGTVTLRDDAVRAFERGSSFEPSHLVTGRRGAYLCRAKTQLKPGQHERWALVADAHLDHAAVVGLRATLQQEADLGAKLENSIAQNRERLASLLDRADGAQASADQSAVAAHRSNVLFNAMRGGVPLDGHAIEAEDFRRFVRTRHAGVAARHERFLASLGDDLRLDTLAERMEAAGDPQLVRIGLEYLPLTFGRRHGDPSRPWNRYRIRIRDEQGNRVTGYEGNWRDIFQNWEAVCRSYPGMLPGVIAKFVNASTADGYNPYRINERGIDWEVMEPDDPRANIGYWGDHQIVYLHRLLDQCRETFPGWLESMAERPIFAFAQVPYRLKPFDDIAANPRSSLLFDDELDTDLRERSDRLGGDGRLRLGSNEEPELVTLLEKLLIPALAKVANLAPGGGVWMNTQRPEWNDANNALAGYGLSMVTLYQLRAYADWCIELFESLGDGNTPISSTIAQWCQATNDEIVRSLEAMNTSGPIDDTVRWGILSALGRAAASARDQMDKQGLGDPVEVERRTLADFFRLTRHLCDRTIATAQRADGLYESYRVLHLGEARAGVESLAPMLEGQVSVLAAGVLADEAAADLLDALFASPLYREDQRTFILYPRVDLPSFVERNAIPEDAVTKSPLLSKSLEAPAAGLATRDAEGRARFNADLVSDDVLDERLESLAKNPEWAKLVEQDAFGVRHAYERTFRHAQYMGRSGSMHKYEGLGSVYWHMVSKLLLAVQEAVFRASDRGAAPETVERLKAHYRRVRDGLGFRKSPTEFGAVPHEPYSHTPWSMGAQQPGMTGQVKEGVLARYGELGIRLQGGTVRFDPILIDPAEILTHPAPLPVRSESDQVERLVEVPAGAIGCTMCGVPVILSLGDADRIVVESSDGVRTIEGSVLPEDVSHTLFARSDAVTVLRVTMRAD